MNGARPSFKDRAPFPRRLFTLRNGRSQAAGFSYATACGTDLHGPREG